MLIRQWVFGAQETFTNNICNELCARAYVSSCGCMFVRSYKEQKKKKFHFVCYWTAMLENIACLQNRDRVWALRTSNEWIRRFSCTHSYKMFRIHETLVTLAHVYLSSWTCFQANNSHFLRLLTKYFDVYVRSLSLSFPVAHFVFVYVC